MVQMTLRAPDELLGRVRSAASARGLSVNEYAIRVLAAATDPDLAGSEAERVRERLAAAGLLDTPERRRGARPDRREVAAARAAAGAGHLLSDLVVAERG